MQAEPPVNAGIQAPGREAGRGAFVSLVAAVLVIVLATASLFFVPLNSFSLSPGPAEDVGRLIQVRGETTYRSKGAFLLTTVSVSVERVRVVDGIRAWLDPEVELVPREALVRPGLDDEQQDALNRMEMEQSKYAAEVVALQASGINVARIPGSRVLGVFPKTPADGKLRDGDVIVAVDGVATPSTAAVSDRIRAKPAGSSVRFSVQRGGASQEFTLRTIPDSEDPSRPIIGVLLAEAFRIPVDISIDSMNIVGPSGGLVFTLAIADALTPDDLTGGHRIAATGTISLDGSVGEIGGVAQKVRAAERVGATLFLVPKNEADEAARAARSLRVIGVSTVREAVEILSSLAPAKAA